MQFGRFLGLPPNMACLGVRGAILTYSQSSSRLSHQIDFSSYLSPSEFSASESKFYLPLDVLRNFDDYDPRCEYEFTVPGNEIPKWFNCQSTESSISFWVGSEFPAFALCLAFCLDGLTDKDTYSYVCVVEIFTNGHKRPFQRRNIFQKLQYDHMWFYGPPHSLLQQVFGDLLQGDQNHVEVSCKISYWTSKTGGNIAPIIARSGVHVECNCHPQNSIIIH